jgi:hypothetical protein
VIAKDLREKELTTLKAEISAQRREVSDTVIADLVDGLQAAAHAIDMLSNQYTTLQARIENLEDALRHMSSTKIAPRGKHR